MKIYIIDNYKFNSAQDKTEIKTLVRSIISQLNLPKNTEICISFIDDISMRELNNSYRGIHRTTDVLSFPQDNEFLGDLVISYPTAIKNAKRYKTKIKYEIQKLIVHGILHLNGYDHKKKKKREIMRAKERELLDAIFELKI
jgi:probable rRNA maturation factor